MELSSQELSRYSRHILLPELGLKGQLRLRQASALIVGLGGLGCPVALYLAAAGLGRIGLLDSDKVDLSNLQRQVLHGSEDLGRLKVESAAAKLRAMNPGVALDLHPLRMEAGNALDLCRPYDLVIEATDNFQAKFLVNDACLSLNKPFLHAGILRFEGQLMAVKPGQSACYRCLFEAAPPAEAVPSCADAGVLGAVAGVLGTLMANEALKLVLDLGQPVLNRMLVFDAKKASFREVQVRRRVDCPACAQAGTGLPPLPEGEAPFCEPAKAS
jgi:adenylyltransferase/sulfurtransferase